VSYANKTSVPVEKTKYEIEATLRRYKADQFMSGWNEGEAFVAFRCRSWIIRFRVKTPMRNERRFTHTEKNKLRVAHLAEQEFEQATRSIWRGLLLCIKAKLESVESGIETFEEAFLAHVVLPGGETMGDWAKTALPQAYANQEAPQLALPMAKGSS